MLVDSHAHLDSERYGGELDPILERAFAAGVGAILAIGIGEGPATMQGALDIARAHRGRPGRPRIYATAGIHPQEAEAADSRALARLDALLGEPEVIGCGEIGLDYYRDHAPVERQKAAFAAQMELAAVHRLPIVIHGRSREASSAALDDILAMLEMRWKPTGLGGILHCFGGTVAQALAAVELGFLVSFAGNLTFPGAGALREAAAAVPLDRLLVETDAPFLAPVPYRGQRNEPARVAETARVLAGLRGLDAGELAAATTRNFERLFGLTLEAAV